MGGIKLSSGAGFTFGVCQGCEKVFTPDNDSEAHVIPNALGGNLKPKGIICRDCNGKLDDVADNHLVDAFGAWPTLLDIPRDRGDNPSKRIPTRGGKTVRLDADGSLTRVDIAYDVVAEAEERHVVTIGAGDMRTFENLLKRATKQFPQLDPQVALAHARKVGVRDGDELKMGVDFSNNKIMGGILSAIWLFLLHRTGHRFMDWDRLLVAIGKMQGDGGNFRHLTAGLPGLVGPEIPIGHKIIIRSNPMTGDLVAYVEILGVLRIGGLFASGSAGHSIEHIYVYDVLNRSDKSDEFSMDAGSFEAVRDWTKEGINPWDVKRLGDHYQEAIAAVYGSRYLERAGEDSSDNFVQTSSE